MGVLLGFKVLVGTGVSLAAGVRVGVGVLTELTVLAMVVKVAVSLGDPVPTDLHPPTINIRNNPKDSPRIKYFKF